MSFPEHIHFLYGRYIEFIRHLLDDKAFGYLKRDVITPAVYLRLVEFLDALLVQLAMAHCTLYMV